MNIYECLYIYMFEYQEGGYQYISMVVMIEEHQRRLAF